MSTHGTPRPFSTAEGFVCGGLAASIAVTFSNPPEVAKTRLQLQGELARNGGQKVYKNAIDVLAKTWRNEGIRGMQRGLGPAVSCPYAFVVSPSQFSSTHIRQALSLGLPLSLRDLFPDSPQRFTLRYIKAVYHLLVELT
ncbi:mitochondrial carrier domain-containing protein [Boletus reticuloceps]|uniref:Mitochondrial carrier domain-containing protein n=1 Tax=Boletus reticuloceps TaxID=495285 RepID=A0A8I2YX36_9AGAM|nr:mitochondrial carrier domain-containing protein [Boletus reticuloceps]